MGYIALQVLSCMEFFVSTVLCFSACIGGVPSCFMYERGLIVFWGWNREVVFGIMNKLIVKCWYL